MASDVTIRSLKIYNILIKYTPSLAKGELKVKSESQRLNFKSWEWAYCSLLTFLLSGVEVCVCVCLWGGFESFIRRGGKASKFYCNVSACTLSLLPYSGFDNYHEIAVRDHIRVPKFCRKWHTWTNTKKRISGLKLFT